MIPLNGRPLLIATHNPGKLAEFTAILSPLGISVASARDHSLPEPAETESTFLGNARIKAMAACSATGLPTLADDSGMEVDALDGAPGVYSADWAQTPDGRDFALAMRRTWDALEGVAAPYPRRARFRCTLVLVFPDALTTGSEQVFDGRVEGQLVWPPRGPSGHGYDPMFLPDGHELTFAEMDATLKNRISHRADALARLVAALGE